MIDACPPDRELERLLADQLSAAEEAALEAHVARCDACQGWLEQLTRGRLTLPGRQGGAFASRENTPRPAGVLDRVADLPPAQVRLLEQEAAPRREGEATRQPLPVPPSGLLAKGPGTHVGPYRLLQKLGEGGMGTVYLAEQERPVRRRVALKVIKSGMETTQGIARFEVERQALALMDHLNIARVLDVGTTEAGLPYFAMDLVHGVPITRYCDDNRLTPRERLGLFLPVCEAVQHAHQKGIIHRDIKPSNVLVALYDGKPVPKVIDFGVAKATDQPLTARTLFTQCGGVVGTLEYMSPEQAETSPLGVDTRSDIYSLGVLLYELLTGTTPVDWKKLPEAGFTDVLRVIRDVEPTRPSIQLSTSDNLPAIAAARRMEPTRLTVLVQGELDWVVMKCLEKDRVRRYETANALARDLQRYLADESVEACPPSTGYRLRRFARKHNKPLAAALTFVLLLLLGVVLSAWQALRATRAERREHEAARQMQAERDRARMALTRQVAERLDGDLHRLATVGRVTATAVAQRADWEEGHLESWMRTVLEQDERIFGYGIGFEPGKFNPKREDYCLYVYRGPGNIRKKYLLPPSYVPLYRGWDWYRIPHREQRSSWTDPYVDTGGGDVPMVSYATPLLRQGQVVGVQTLDLSVKYFEELRGWLKELNLGEKSYGFVVNQTGIIVCHPHPEYDFAHVVAANKRPRKIAELGEVDPSFAALVRRFREDKTGRATALDPSTGRPATFLFAPVPSAGWTFVVAIEETTEAPSP